MTGHVQERALQERDTEHYKGLGEDFPGGPVVKTVHLQRQSCRFNPWLRS